MKYEDNPITIDVHSRKRNQVQKMYCVLCNKEKVQLICFNSEENRWKCPRCKNDYQLGFGEIVPQEDILSSSHDEDDNGIGLLVAGEDEFNPDNNNNESKSGIKIPKYMQDSETSTVTYYREQ